MVTRRRGHGLATALAITLAIAAPHVAIAQDGPDLADSVASEARRLFELGLQQLDAANFAGAADSFEQSLALRRSPAALYNLGLALRGQHAYRRAAEVFDQLLALLGPQADSPVCSAARTIGAEMRQQIARVHLTVRGLSEQVSIDGAPVLQNDGVRDVDFDPGLHTFEVRRRGHAPQRVERSLGPGEQASVEIDAAAAPLQASLDVHSNQPSADIRIDGVARGLGVFTGGIAPVGTHQLEARIDGRVVWHREATLEPGSGMRIGLTLPAPRSALWTNGWLWAGAGVVVVGLVSLVVAAAPRVPMPENTSFGQTQDALMAR